MSSTKRVLRPYRVIDGVSMAADITGSETSVQFLDYVSLTVEWTGSAPVGVLNIEVLKIEAERNTATGVDVWQKLDFGGAIGTDIPISGASGSDQIIITELATPKIRAFYKRTSGTGTLNVTLVGKER